MPLATCILPILSTRIRVKMSFVAKRGSRGVSAIFKFQAHQAMFGRIYEVICGRLLHRWRRYWRSIGLIRLEIGPTQMTTDFVTLSYYFCWQRNDKFLWCSIGLCWSGLRWLIAEMNQTINPLAHNNLHVYLNSVGLIRDRDGSIACPIVCQTAVTVHV